MPNDCRYSLTNPNVVHETIDGETIILKLDTGVYYSLNDLRATVWSLLGRGCGVDEIAAMCAIGFDAPRTQIEESARELVADLEREELIVAASACPASAGTPIDHALPEIALASGRALRRPILRKYDDMQDLLLIDPFHDVPQEGWPERKAVYGPSQVSPSPIAAS